MMNLVAFLSLLVVVFFPFKFSVLTAGTFGFLLGLGGFRFVCLLFCFGYRYFISYISYLVFWVVFFLRRLVLGHFAHGVVLGKK